MKKEKKSEVFVGLFLLVGLLVLCGLVVKFGSLGDGELKDQYSVYVTFKDASGLIKGSEVRMGGAKIGKVVDTPELTEELTVRLEVVLDGRVKIDENSVFQIQSVSFIGDKMIAILPPEVAARSGKIIADGAEVIGGGAGGLDALQSDAASVAQDARLLMASAKVTMDKFNIALDEINSVSRALSVSIERINGGILDDENLANFKKTMKNLEETTASFKRLGDDARPTLVEIQAAIASIKQAADSANKAFADAGGLVKKLEPSIAGIPATLTSLKKASNKAMILMDNANKVVAKMDNSKGLLNTLTSDKEFDSDTKKFVKNLKHYGILRYKDDETYDEKDPKKSRYRSTRRR